MNARLDKRRDSFTLLRENARWRIALILCVFGMTTLLALGVLNWRGGRIDSVWLSVVVFLLLAACLAMLLLMPRRLGGKIYFWMSVVIIGFLPWFGYLQGRTFHYWMYVFPPVLFFVLRPRAALVGNIAFGVYACAMIVPFTMAIDVARIAMSYALLVGFMYTYALLEEHAATMLRYHSDHDALTNCLNRRTFNERLEQIEGTADACAFLLIDIDRFKAINDQHGHLVGDRVITQVAAALVRVLGTEAELFRYGGEEFAAILPGNSVEEARQIGERLRRAVEDGDFGPVPVTISLGLALWTPGRESLAASLDAADRALYAAKRGGRNRLVLAQDATQPFPQSAQR